MLTQRHPMIALDAIVKNSEAEYFQIFILDTSKGLLSWKGDGFETVIKDTFPSKAIKKDKIIQEYTTAAEIGRMHHSGEIFINEILSIK